MVGELLLDLEAANFLFPGELEVFGGLNILPDLLLVLLHKAVMVHQLQVLRIILLGLLGVLLPALVNGVIVLGEVKRHLQIPTLIQLLQQTDLDLLDFLVR